MINIPSPLQAQFVNWLRNRAVSNNAIASYLKWLRYYLDFCEKYHFPNAQTDRIPHFLGKLQQKKQTEAQQPQTLHAITLHYELLQDWEPGSQFCSPQEKIAHGKSANSVLRPSFRSSGIMERFKESARTGSLLELLRLDLSTPRTADLSHGLSWESGICWAVRIFSASRQTPMMRVPQMELLLSLVRIGRAAISVGLSGVPRSPITLLVGFGH